MSNDSTLARPMTMDEDISPHQQVAARKLPWVIGIAGLVIYLITLNHWLSFSSLGQVAKVSGWTWYPELSAPLYWLLTSPFKLLPPKLVPLALNSLSAVFGALTLALLARSVALLPHDRTLAQRERERGPWSLLSIRAAWVPPVFAAMVCGLQLSFWESATNASTSGTLSVSSHMLDVMLLAYVIRCLLEHRIDDQESWLTRAAFVYAIGITNDWAMIGFLPLFIIALVWIKGMSFFNPQLLTRMFLCGLAGLSLYLIQPAYYSLADVGNVPFWAGLRSNLGTQKYMLSIFASDKQVLLALSLTSIVPILIIGIRWPSFLGDTSAKGIALAKLMFHAVHACLFIACLWVALDPPVSPRNQNLGVPYLSFYYLAALSVGYFTGYFLLVFGKTSLRNRRVEPLTKLIQMFATGCVWAVFILVPAVLLYRNLPQVRISNGPLLREYAEQLVASLPDEPVAVLSDDLARLTLLQAASAQSGKPRDWLYLYTSALRIPDYHYFLREKCGQRWPYDPPPDRTRALAEIDVLGKIVNLGEKRKLFYLHPSFGYYFEALYPEPNGLAYQLHPYSPGNALPPALSEEVIKYNEAFWEKVSSESLPKVLNALAINVGGGLLDPVFQSLRLKKQPNRDATILGGYYSRALTYWGTEEQKLNRLKPAEDSFARALKLNPENQVARLDLSSNQKLQRDDKAPHQPISAFDGLLRKYQSLDQLVSENGPLDEPTLCHERGNAFFRGNNYRQSAQQFQRAVELDPGYLEPYLALGLLYTTIQLPKEALKILDKANARPEMAESIHHQRGEVLFVELSALLACNEDATAAHRVQTALANAPGDTNIIWAAEQAFIRSAAVTNTAGRYSEAMSVIDHELKLFPNKSDSLLNKGWLCIQLGRFQDAIPPLNRVVEIETSNVDMAHRARLNRAIAFLQLEQLPEAQKDYTELQKVYTNSVPLLYGLGEIAYRSKDTNGAVNYYEQYLRAISNAPISDEAALVKTRLQELKPGPR
jgi:tetratricopeptide (TPR) repeat protein